MPASTLPPQTHKLLSDIPALIKKTFPIPGRFRSALPSDIAELSRLLTNKRGDRSLSYLGRPNFLSAYLHYFMPWNLYRLCLLIPHIDLCLSPRDTITDIGCGPLTFASALWIARPDLRNIPLEFFCIDRSSPALDAGKKFFAALSNGENRWNIHLVRQDIDIRQANVMRKIKPASLVCAINMFNEIYETLPHNNAEGLRRMAANSAQLLRSLSSDDAFILTVEPGVPQSGRFISFLRASLLELGRPPVSPCPHTLPCPLTKKRWCHLHLKHLKRQKNFSASRPPQDFPRSGLFSVFYWQQPKPRLPMQKQKKKKRASSPTLSHYTTIVTDVTAAARRDSSFLREKKAAWRERLL